MEFPNRIMRPTLTLTLVNPSSEVSSSDWVYRDQLPSCSMNSEHCLVANSPPYSPPGLAFDRNSFSFFTRSISMFSDHSKRRFRFGRLFSIYTKILLIGMMFVCFLLLEISSNSGISPKTAIHEKGEDETENGENAYRLRRELQESIRDGPVLDLGDGYQANRGSDVLITVKTSRKYYSTRLMDILDTWYRLAPDQIYFITDQTDEKLNRRIGNRIVPTSCPAGHHRHALCCKQSVEYETYLKHGRSWWCHFDDDNYVNVPQLMRTLSQYDPRQDWYLGKPSTKGPIEAPYEDYALKSDSGLSNERIPFWFATGGAGFCISKSLAVKMRPYAADGKFVALCDRIRLPDDVTIGFIIEVLLGKNLTVIPQFHSHLENMRSIDTDRLHEQVSLSGGSYDGRDRNLVNVDSFFSDSDDPRRFRSLHCHLYPMAAVCKAQKVSKNIADTN